MTLKPKKLVLLLKSEKETLMFLCSWTDPKQIPAVKSLPSWAQQSQRCTARSRRVSSRGAAPQAGPSLALLDDVQTNAYLVCSLPVIFHGGQPFNEIVTLQCNPFVFEVCVSDFQKAKGHPGREGSGW